MIASSASSTSLAEAVRKFTNADSLYRQKYAFTRAQAEYLAELMAEAAKRLEALPAVNARVGG